MEISPDIVDRRHGLFGKLLARLGMPGLADSICNVADGLAHPDYENRLSDAMKSTHLPGNASTMSGLCDPSQSSTSFLTSLVVAHELGREQAKRQPGVTSPTYR